MSTINGCGTQHYDWLHLPDGTACATKWFVLFFLPVIPLKREHLRVVDASALRGTHYVLGKIPMHGIGIARTYMKAYLLAPLILLGPPAVLFFVYFRLLRYLPVQFGSRWIPGAIAVLCLIYWGIVLSLILERSFGRKPPAKKP
jgi:hypothetical protein